jgi:hypothetical protein
MTRLVLVLMLLGALILGATGCKSSGSREYIPGTGWVPN